MNRHIIECDGIGAGKGCAASIPWDSGSPTPRWLVLRISRLAVSGFEELHFCEACSLHFASSLKAGSMKSIGFQRKED